jgi:NitT/TauT family transport system permease protein
MTSEPSGLAAPPLNAPPPESWLDHVPRGVSILVVGLLALGIWQAVYTIHVMSALLLPGPVETFEQIVNSAQNIAAGQHVAEALWITTQEVIVGFLLAAALGFFLGVVVGETKLGRVAVMPYLVGFNALPKVAFAPVFVAWLGFGIESKIVMALFVAFFPMIVDTAAGLASVDRDSLMLFRSLEASRWTTLIKLKLPMALPFVFAGLKSAAVFSVVGAVVGEYLGGGGGMGELVRLSAQQLRIDRVFALIVYLGVIGLGLFAVIAWLERRIVFWNQPEAIDIVATA